MDNNESIGTVKNSNNSGLKGNQTEEDGEIGES